MKLSILQENLKAALTKAAPAIAGRSTLPVLSNVLLRATDSALHVTANNFELAITAPVVAKVEVQGATTVPGKLLAELVSSFPPERIDLEFDESTERLNIRCARNDTSLATIAADEFPLPARLEGSESWPLSGEQLRNLIRRTVFAAATDEARPVFTGVLLRITETGLTLAAADGFRLSVVEANGQSGLTPGQFIIPAAALATVAKLIEDDTETVRLSVSGNRSVTFDVDGITLTTQLIEGEFPDYTRIVPAGWATRAVVDAAALQRAVKVGNLFARDSARLMTFQFNPAIDDAGGWITLEGHSAEMGDGASELDAQVEGDELLVAFDAKYVLDLLGVIEGQLVIESNGESSAGKFRQVGDDNFTHVIMPMHTRK